MAVAAAVVGLESFSPTLKRDLPYIFVTFHDSLRPMSQIKGKKTRSSDLAGSPKEVGGKRMGAILTAVVMGIIGGLLVKALFLKDSHILWDAVFGVVGGLTAYYLSTSVSSDVTTYLYTMGMAVLVAGILHEVWKRFGKTA